MNILDIVVIFSYLLIMMGIGLYANKKQNDIKDYYVAGKTVSGASMMCLWVSYWVGGATMLGTVSDTYEIGIAGAIYPMTVAVGLIFFGIFFAGTYNKLGTRFDYLTLPDLIEDRYDQRSGLVTAITMIVIYVSYTAAQLVACASIISVLSGWPLWQCYILSTVVVVIYTSVGGYLAVTYTDWAQFALLIFGVFILALPAALNRVGGISPVLEGVPSEFFSFSGTSVSGVFAMFLSTVLCFFTNMDTFTRCFSVKTPRAAMYGTITAGVVVLIIGLLTMLLGLTAKVAMPGLEDTSNVLGLFVFELFPGGMRALVLIGVLSAAMSSGDICILTASANFTNDIYKRWINPNVSEKKLLRLGVLASLFIGTVSALLAWFVPNVIDVLFIGINIASATLFFPVVCGLYWNKGTKAASFWSSLVTLILVTAWSLANNFGIGGIFTLDSVYPGLLCSAILYFGISLAKTPSENERERIEHFTKIVKES